MVGHRGQSGVGLSIGSPHGNTHIAKRELGDVESLIREIVDLTVDKGYGVVQTRYPTTGDHRNKKNLQPFKFTIGSEIFYLVFNGNLVNYEALKLEYSDLVSTTDTEILGRKFSEGFISVEGDLKEQIFAGVQHVLETCFGGYSVIIHREKGGLIAFRDAFGTRPLVMAESEAEGFIGFASETQAFPQGVKGLKIKDVNPAEVFFYQEDVGMHHRQFETSATAYDVFELIYLAKELGDYNGVSVMKVKRGFGIKLAEQCRQEFAQSGWKPSIVIPVPNTSLVAGASLFESLHKDYPTLQYGAGAISVNPASQRGLRYFIGATGEEQDRILKEKHFIIESMVIGQDILLVDDSIVRGKTMKHLIERLLALGAKSVVVVIGCPPIIGTDHYGIATPDESELISAQMSNEELREYLGATQLIFLTLENLKEVLKWHYPGKNFHLGYFNKIYHVGTPADYLVTT